MDPGGILEDILDIIWKFVVHPAEREKRVCHELRHMKCPKLIEVNQLATTLIFGHQVRNYTLELNLSVPCAL